MFANSTTLLMSHDPAENLPEGKYSSSIKVNKEDQDEVVMGDSPRDRKVTR